MLSAPDTQKSHPWRSSRAVQARDGPAHTTFISAFVACPPLRLNELSVRVRRFVETLAPRLIRRFAWFAN